MAPKKRRPGGGRKPTLNKVSTFSTRITAETRHALEVEAKKSGMSISQLAETLMAGKLKEQRDKDIGSPIQALTFLVESIAQLSKSSAEGGRICEWNSDPTVFEIFRIALEKLLDRLKPPGEIDSSIEGPLIGKTPEQEAESIVRSIWSELHSAEALNSTELNKLFAHRGWRTAQQNVVAIAASSYTAAKVRKALNINANVESKK
jgi:hypothetical protein